MVTGLRLGVAGILSVLFFLMLSVYPLQHLPLFEYAYDWRRILELTILSVTAIWLLLDLSLRQQWLECYQQIPRLARIGILIFFGLGLISSVLAPLPQFALMQVGMYGLLWMTTLTIAALRVIYGQAFDRWILAVLMVMCGCYGFYLLLTDIQLWFFAAGQGMGSVEFQYALLAPSFMNIRFFANVISFSLPLIVLPSLLYRHHPRLLRWVYFAVSAIWWYALILNHCQTLWLEWVVIPIFTFIWFRAEGFVWLKQQVKAAVGGLVLYVLLTAIIPWLLNIAVTTAVLAGSSDGRLPLWWYTLKMIVHHPLLGVGPLHFAYYVNEKLPLAHPHNSILLIAAEWGIPAMLMLLSLVLWGLVGWVKRYPLLKGVGVERVKYIALSAAFLGGAIDSLLSGVIVMPLSQAMLVLVVGWMFGFYQSEKKHDTIVVVKAHTWFMAALLIALALLWHGVYPLILHLPQQVMIYIQEGCGGVYDSSCAISPSFWTQGWIKYYVAS